SASRIGVIGLLGLVEFRQSLLSEIMGGMDLRWFGQQFDQLVSDPTVSAVIIEIDSPGGGATGVPEMSAKIRAARAVKPVIAHVNGVAGSAAFWIASAASQVIATPSAEVGSVGAFLLHTDFSEMLAAEGIKPTLIRAPALKAAGNPYEPLPPE